MKEQNHTSHNYPTLEELKAYWEGGLSEEERQRIEALAVDDPLFADVLEGLSEVKDTAVVAAAVQRISSTNTKRLSQRQAKREKLSKRQSRVIPTQYWQYFAGAAASLALLLVSVWLIRQPAKKANMIASEQAPMETQDTEIPEELTSSRGGLETPIVDSTITFADAIASETLVDQPAPESPAIQRELIAANHPVEPEIAEEAVPSTMETPTDGMGQSVYLNSNSTTPAINPAEMLDDEELIVAAPAPDPTAPATEANSTDDSYDDFKGIPLEGMSGSGDEIAMDRKERSARQVVSQQVTEVPVLSEEEQVQGSLAKVTAVSDLMLEGIQLYDQGSYPTAKLKFEEVLIAIPAHVVAHFYLGKVAVQEKDYKTAIAKFKYVLKYPEANSYDEAEWNLALTYELADKENQSKRLLQRIANSSSAYAPQAQQKLLEGN
ncbi:hypothetical protein [Pontibacter sp. G13]|uniref:tetratricopeptide repeat protein n=1 Tax=Pontibacter sp. G13 TaxID=3074898 RepID=UPI00288C2910|nr:hypothetical protein [Pontibacter sp. G13]WNJ16015.1 hypothetical protein RJD25_14225 [Pontibacter sp. G13]